MTGTLRIALHGERDPALAEAVRVALLDAPALSVVSIGDCDVVLDLAGDYPVDAAPEVWRFEFAGAAQPSGAGLRAMHADGIETALWSHGAGRLPLCLYRSVGALQTHALRRTVSQAVSKTAQFPGRAAWRMAEGVSRACPNEAHRCAHAARGFPAAWQGIPAACQAWIGKAIRKLVCREQWYVVLQREAGVAMPCRAEILLYPPRDRFWADPFLAQHAGRTWLFVEELMFGSARAHISAMEIDAQGQAGRPLRVLERPYHLSYPFLFEWDGGWWMLPETSHNRTVELYRCISFPDQWKLEAVLLRDVRAADCTLWQEAGRWWMFANMASPAASIHDELHLYFADSPLGPWQAHPLNPVKSDARSSRPAGALFRDGEALIRPAQDCGVAYGRAIVLNRVEVLTTDDYRESVAGRIEPDELGAECTHTLNRAGGWRVLDALRCLPRTGRE